MNRKMYNPAMWRSVSTQEAYEMNGGGSPSKVFKYVVDWIIDLIEKLS